MTITRITPLLLCATLLSLPSAGGEARSKADSILDMLENRLMEKERKALSFGDEAPPRAFGDPTKERFIFESSPPIQSRLPGSDQLSKIAQAIDALERDIEQLATDSQNIKQETMRRSKIDNVSEISVKIADEKAIVVRELQLKLDDYPIYEHSGSVGFWSPGGETLLFSGPLNAGNHLLEVRVRVAKLSNQGLPLQNDIYARMHKRFTLQVPETQKKEQWTILVATPEKNDDHDKLSIESKSPGLGENNGK